MKVVILTDSLGLPRSVPEKVSLEETYIEKLRERYRDIRFVTLSIGGVTLPTLQQQFFNYFQAVEPDLVILHAGIVDAAPRALKGWETAIINSNPLSRWLYGFLFKKHTAYIRKVRKITYTPLTVFGNIASAFYQSLGRKVIWLGIVPADHAYETNLPGITKNIEAYNEKLQSIFLNRYIDLSHFPPNGIMNDHHHITTVGHQYIFEKLTQIIDEEISGAMYAF